MSKQIDERLVQHSLNVLTNTIHLEDPTERAKRLEGFEWPEFNTERERIKHNTERYKGMDLQDVFAKEYGVKFSKKFLSVAHDDNYRDLNPGDIVPLQILEVNKKGVIFKQDNIKETIICAANLYQYPRFRDFIPSKPIDCKVISRTLDKIVVDPFAGMLDDWINEHTTNLQNQYSIIQDKSIEVSNLRLVRGGFTGSVRIDTISDFCGKDMFIEAFVPGSQIVLNIEYDFESWSGKSVRAFITNYSNKPNSTDMTLICSAKEYLRHQGNMLLIKWFKDWCEENEAWKIVRDSSFEGIITGVCHTANKCGAFVELPQHITAMVPCQPDELSNFKRGATINVKLDRFEEPTRWNGLQTEHLNPYVIEDSILKRFSLRLILKQA